MTTLIYPSSFNKYPTPIVSISWIYLCKYGTDGDISTLTPEGHDKPFPCKMLHLSNVTQLGTVYKGIIQSQYNMSTVIVLILSVINMGNNNVRIW